MKKEEIKRNLNNQIDLASKVEIVLASDGWKIFEEILAQKKDELTDIFKISTLKELEANKKALKQIESAINDFKNIVNSGFQAREDLEKLDATS